MSTIEIFGRNQEYAQPTAWSLHARSELKKRLRRGIKGAPADSRRWVRQIIDGQPVTLPQVHDEAVYGLTRIFETMGVDFHLALENADTARLLSNCPERRIIS